MPDKKVITGEIFLTPAVVDGWKEVIRKVLILPIPIRPEEIGEETFLLNPDGKTLTLSCTVGKVVVSMHIPEGEWSRIGYAQ